MTAVSVHRPTTRQNVQVLQFVPEISAVNGKRVQSKVNTGLSRSKSAYGARL
jgi:hypothetical protein